MTLNLVIHTLPHVSYFYFYLMSYLTFILVVERLVELKDDFRDRILLFAVPRELRFEYRSFIGVPVAESLFF